MFRTYLRYKELSSTHKLKQVLNLIVDYDSCFFLLSPPFSSLRFLLFSAFVICAYMGPVYFVKFSSLLAFSLL